MRIAVIGAGVAGLAAAYLLRRSHDVVLYEKEARCGGHARTIDVIVEGVTVPVDTGFMVCNDRNYPAFRAMLTHLGVPVQPAAMSFGVTIDGGWLEYGSRIPFSIFGQARNIGRPAFLGMLRDIVRFNRAGARAVRDGLADDVGLDAWLDTIGVGTWFRRYYLLPMLACIWSAPVAGMHRVPARAYLRFLDEHGLLTVFDQPQWRTLVGGSRCYVAALAAALGPSVRMVAARKIQRTADAVSIEDAHGSTEVFDQVVLACHADEARALLADAADDESRALGAIRYESSRVVVHADLRLMPRRRACWSCWNYVLDGRTDARPRITTTYWLDALQSLHVPRPVFATLNPEREPNHILNDATMMHPYLDAGAFRAQAVLRQRQGQNRTWFAGAYLGYGFHEDGVQSAVAVAGALGSAVPW